MPSTCRECGSPTVGRGLCRRHYNAWYGETQLTEQKRVEYQQRYCERFGERDKLARRKPKFMKSCDECGTPFQNGKAGPPILSAEV
jgi:hypothetical protein